MSKFTFTSRQTQERCGLLFLGIIFIALACWSWRKWTYAQFDFGLQLYTPWQLAQGKVLYRDISYIAGGPLSQYYHALLFRVFGVSYIVIALSNLVIAWLTTWGLFRLFARTADLLTAYAVSVVTLCVFVFGHLIAIGNYNFITPYTCETVHGFALSVLAIAWLCRWIASGQTRWAFAAGLATGGVFLTKPEIFLALADAVAVALVVRETTLAVPAGGRWKNLSALAAGAALPAILFTVYFAKVWPTRGGLLAAAGAWLPLFGGKAGHGQFYDWCLGLDVPGENLAQMAQYTGVLVLAAAALALGARFVAQRKYALAGLLWLALAGFLFSSANKLEWVQGGRALPLLTLAGGTFIARRWWLCRREPIGATLVFPLLWAAFALLLLAKMGLNSRIWQYGFYLALPATALLLFVAFRLLPPLLARFEVDEKIFRASLAIFFAVGVVKLLALSNHYYSQKTLAAGSGGDRILIYAEDAGEGIAQTVDWLRAHTGESETLAVLPEGAMVNYLARRINPTPFLVAGPHELQVAGEANVIAAYAARPPAWLLLLHRDTAEFGVGYFGAKDGYGQDLMRWVKTNYSAEWQFGNEPLVTNRFGIEMFRHSTP
jgi:hypothetical protein